MGAWYCFVGIYGEFSLLFDACVNSLLKGFHNSSIISKTETWLCLFCDEDGTLERTFDTLAWLENLRIHQKAKKQRFKQNGNAFS